MDDHTGGWLKKALTCKVCRMYKGASEYETAASPKAIPKTQPSPPRNYRRRSMMSQARSCVYIYISS